MHVPIFSGKGVFWPWEDFPRKPEKGVFFVIANGNQYPKYGVYHKIGGSGDGERAYRYPLV